MKTIKENKNLTFFVCKHLKDFQTDGLPAAVLNCIAKRDKRCSSRENGEYQTGLIGV